MARPRKKIDLKTYEGRFAWRLMVLREKAGLSVEELAEQLGIAPTTLYGWEIGYRLPRISELPKLAIALKMKKAKDILPNE